MSHLLTIAALVLRLCIGLVAAVSFYTAFFMYEDEKGGWQNRLEELWTSVYDRAKLTDSTTTALFNRLAATLENIFEQVFGRRLLSLKAVLVSANLTVGLGLLASLALWKFVQPALRTVLDHTSAAHDGLTYRTYVSVFELSCLWGDLLEQIVHYGYFWNTVVAAIFVLCAFLSSNARTKVTLCWLNAPLALFVAKALQKNPRLWYANIDQRYLYLYVPAILLLSVGWDFVAIVVIRQLFAASINVVKPGRVVRLLVQFTLFALLSTCLPVILSWVFIVYFRRFTVLTLYVDNLTNLLTIFNVTTFIYCMAPLVCLATVLAHRVMWPVLGRLLYPLAAEKVIGNRKVLVSVGSASISYAVTGGHITLDSLLKLLK